MTKLFCLYIQVLRFLVSVINLVIPLRLFGCVENRDRFFHHILNVHITYVAALIIFHLMPTLTVRMFPSKAHLFLTECVVCTSGVVCGGLEEMGESECSSTGARSEDNSLFLGWGGRGQGVWSIRYAETERDGRLFSLLGHGACGRLGEGVCVCVSVWVCVCV